MEKRLKRMKETISDLYDTQREVKITLSQRPSPSPKSSNIDLEEQKQTRDDQGEYAMTRGKDNQQLIQQQKQLIRQQDDQLDEIHGIV